MERQSRVCACVCVCANPMVEEEVDHAVADVRSRRLSRVHARADEKHLWMRCGGEEEGRSSE